MSSSAKAWVSFNPMGIVGRRVESYEPKMRHWPRGRIVPEVVRRAILRHINKGYQ